MMETKLKKKNKNENKRSTSVTKTSDLPDIPTKIYFTIGEVCRLCELKTHVLRYWEVVFPVLNPSKRRGRRYYKRDDIILVRQIRELLYEKGYTIEGASAQLSKGQVSSDKSTSDFSDVATHHIRATLGQLEQVIQELD